MVRDRALHGEAAVGTKDMGATQGGSSYAVGVGLATVSSCIEDEALEAAHEVDLHFVAGPHPYEFLFAVHLDHPSEPEPFIR